MEQQPIVEWSRRAALQAEAEAARIRRLVELNYPPGFGLTYEQYQAGEPCPGCGEPYIIERREWHGSANLTPEERADWEAEDARFKAAHGECQSMRWSTSGGWNFHCHRCCPLPPWSAERTADYVAFMTSLKARQPKERDIWRVELTCAHIVDCKRPPGERWTSRDVDCTECEGESSRGVVRAELISFAADRLADGERRRVEAQDAVEKAERELRRAKSKLQRLEKNAGP